MGVLLLHLTEKDAAASFRCWVPIRVGVCSRLRPTISPPAAQPQPSLAKVGTKKKKGGDEGRGHKGKGGRGVRAQQRGWERGPGGSTARAAGQSRGRTEQGTAAQGGRGCDHGSERRCKVKSWSGVGLGAPDGGIKRRWKPLGLAQRFTAVGAGAGGGFLAPHSPGGDNLEAAPGVDCLWGAFQ